MMRVRSCPARLMAASPFQLLSYPRLPPIPVQRLMQGVVPETGGFEGLCNIAAEVWFAENQSPSPGKGMPPKELQELLWQYFFSDPTQWRDNRRSKPTPSLQLPDFSHKKSRVALCLDNEHKPAWVNLQLAKWDTGMKRPPVSISSSSVQGTVGRLAGPEGHSELGICRKLCEDGLITDAVDILTCLVQREYRVDKDLYYRLLKRCIADKEIVLGRHIHALTVKSGYEGDAFLATHLIGLYASVGTLEEALYVFTKVCTPSCYNWSTIILAYARHGEAAVAIQLYRQMRQSTVKPSDHMYVAVLKACATARDLVAGKEVHAHVLATPGKANIFVQTGLVNMYAKCGSMEDARRLFDSLADRNVVTWTTMIAGYVQHGMGQEAVRLFSRMQEEGITPPDSVTFVCLLQACASVGVGALQQGKQLHAQLEKQGLQNNVVVGGSLVNMYARCGSLEAARRVFDRLSARNVVTWTAMIANYAQQGKGQEALSLYDGMQLEGVTPNSVTFVGLLQACASVGEGALRQGERIHAQIVEKGWQDDVILGGSLVNMYAKCGSLEDARRVFDRLQDRSVVAWTAMFAGYVQQGMGQEALSLYSIMQQEGITCPDSFTFACLLHACAIVAALPLGRQLHAQIQERGLQADSVVGAALVNMYAKCGSMVDSWHVFYSLPERSIEAWNALTGGYTRQGDCEAVFNLVHRMRLEGVQPDGITFLCVLTVCSHVGLVEKGRKCFEAMTASYGISPTVDHYACMMDLLGRAGHLDEALQMAKGMPFPPNGSVWRTLLGACQKWNNVEVGQESFEFAVMVDGKHAASYVLMSNIYASTQMWEAEKEMQARRVTSGALKKPGQSWWTDTNGMVHMFEVGDKKHPECSYLCKDEIASPKMKEEGTAK